MDLLCSLWRKRALYEPQFAQAIELEKVRKLWFKLNPPQPSIQLLNDCTVVRSEVNQKFPDLLKAQRN